MPKKDDKECGCTGSIDLEKTTKNINLNISKQTRVIYRTDYKTNYDTRKRADCSGLPIKDNVAKSSSCEKTVQE